MFAEQGNVDDMTAARDAMDAAGRGRDASGALVRAVPDPAVLLCMLRAYCAAGAEFAGNAGEVMGELRTHAAYIDEGPAGRELRAQAAAVMRGMGTSGGGVAAKAPVRRTSVADDNAALKAAERTRMRAASASVAAAFDAPFDAEVAASDAATGGRRRGGVGGRGELR